VVLRRVPPGVVGELEPIMMAAADSFLAEAVVGFMKLSDADAVDRAVLTVVDPVDAVDESGRRGLDRAAVVAVMLGVEVADRLRKFKITNEYFFTNSDGFLKQKLPLT